MAGWREIKAAYAALNKACVEDGGNETSWKNFADAVEACAAEPPYHLRLVLQIVEEARHGRAKSDVRILDHGCGGGLVLLYLLALGYEGVYGVDIGGSCETLNKIVNTHLGLKDKRFFVYDGAKLPFGDDMFDVIFSNQVLEHVEPAVLENYYEEEARTLAPGGLAYHQVPHRLVPYESHTQIWFLHYLPRPVWLAILRALGRDMTVPEGALFLRAPWLHHKLLRRTIGNYEDRTMQRFVGLNDLSYYDGPVRLRRALSSVLKLPVVGWAGRRRLTNFVMLDTVSRKPVARPNAADRAAPPESLVR